MNGLKALLTSKKAWAMIIGLLGVVLVQVFGMDEESAAKLTKAIETIVGIYIGGQAIADGLSKGATSNTVKTEE